MPLHNLYRQLNVPRYDSTWGWSGRNEAANTVVFQIDATKLRDATVSERVNGIAKVHEFTEGDITDWRRTCQQLNLREPEAQPGWKFMLDDLAFAHEEESCVHAILFHGKDGLKGPQAKAEWELLPNLGQVVEFDRDAGTYKIVFFG